MPLSSRLMPSSVAAMIFGSDGRVVVVLKKNRKRYVNVARGVTTYRNHLDFTRTCRERNVIPRSLQLKRLVHTAEGNKIIAQAERRLLNARIHECHSVIKKKELDLFFLRRQLQHRLPDIFPSLEEFARNVAATTAQKQQATHKSKLATLQGEKHHYSPDNENFVVNLSSKQLSPTEHSVLAKEHNFNTTTTRPSLPKIIAATEEGIRRLDSGIRENVRLKAIGVLSKIGKRREHNLSREECKAIHALRNDDKVVILPADKGNAMVLLDREAYNDKVRDLLDSPAYEKLTKDPTPSVQREMNKLLADIFKAHPKARNTYLQLICRNGSAPGFYGLPKTHKPTVPLRPIVDFTTSPLRALSNRGTAGVRSPVPGGQFCIRSSPSCESWSRRCHWISSSWLHRRFDSSESLSSDCPSNLAQYCC
ncbi:uncharacterized protein LOC142775115 [Rhipicephalus microplus]|uniref:uncharacterized protein LOC142775115 n=1 Tax=Rhipicephalus microplus TaxID=6941 RepID=UPI003F6CFC64